MKTDLDVKITSYLAIASFLFVAAFRFDSASLFSIVSSAIALTAMLRFAYVKWIWKLPWMRCLECIHKVPVLEGEWEGEFVSTGNEKTPPDKLIGDVEVKIVQPNIHSIKIVRHSKESTSVSIAESLVVSEDELIHLTYTYRSEPNANVRERSQMSYGTARLLYKREPVEKLSGNYWTDQKTTGTFMLTRKTSKSP